MASRESFFSGWVPKVTLADLRDLVKDTVTGWIEDNAPRLGAALAFYTLLSIAPTIIVVIAVAGMAFGQKAAEGRLIWEMQDLIGYQGALAIQGLLKSAHTSQSGGLATILGLVTLVFGATGVVNELRDALNTIWHVPPRPDANTWQNLLTWARVRVFSFGVVVGIGFLLMVSLVVNAWLAAVGRFFDSVLPLPEWVLQTAYTLFSFAVIAVLFAILYKVLPDVRLQWKDLWVGAGVTSFLFSIGKLLIGLYLGKTSVANTYGAAGSLVIVLVWVYYSAQIFFLGAEFTCAYTHKFGSEFKRTLDLHPSSPEAVIVKPGTENQPAAAQPGTLITP